MSGLLWQGGDLYLQVRVQPRASRNQVSGWVGERLKISLTAPPVDGAANEALCVFLARELGLAKSQVVLVRGESSREKTVRVIGAEAPTIQQKITDWLKPTKPL